MPHANTTNRGLTIALVAVVVIGIGMLLTVPTVREVKAERKCGRSHFFEIDSSPSFLPDSLAFTKAVDALRIQGFDTNRWRLMPYLQTKAPGGSVDQHLCHNHVDDNRGVVTFTNAEGKLREVYVELTNDGIVCQVRRSRAPIR